jgi:transketolase
VRNAFVQELTKLAEQDPNIILITGDLGFGVLTEYARRFPRQYINAGVAEQNMTALAVGLALEGKTVYTYSIANFPTLRCLEQIRNDACYHRANVKIVSIGAGFAYGPLGMSHHATEDIAIMRALPNLTFYSPADQHEVRLVTRASHVTAGVCYLRLGRGGEPAIHSREPVFKAGEAIELSPAADVLILATGGILAVGVEARTRLTESGVQAGVFSIPTLKPFPAAWLREVARRAKFIVTLEEHSRVGGLGGAVAEVLAEQREHGVLLRFGLNDEFSCTVGSQDYLRGRYGLTSSAVVARVAAALAAG